MVKGRNGCASRITLSCSAVIPIFPERSCSRCQLRELYNTREQGRQRGAIPDAVWNERRLPSLAGGPCHSICGFGSLAEAGMARTWGRTRRVRHLDECSAWEREGVSQLARIPTGRGRQRQPVDTPLETARSVTPPEARFRASQQSSTSPLQQGRLVRFPFVPYRGILHNR